jgi:recombination protein RecT
MEKSWRCYERTGEALQGQQAANLQDSKQSKMEIHTAMTDKVATTQKQPATILSCLQTDTWKEEVSKVLPKYLTPERILRIARSVALEPKFKQCNPQSFLLALIKCAQAGLEPDGRVAHLIPYGQEVQAIFDWKGLVSLASRNGISVVPKLVYAADEFSVQEDDGTGHTRVIHNIDIRKPRGEVVAVYSRAVTGEEADYEFMTADEVEYVRQTFSRAKNADAWTKSWGEMAKKTVIRRHSKRWDLPPEVRDAINADDDTPPPMVQAQPFARPLFSTPAKPEPAQPVIEDAPVMNQLKAVRGLCAGAKIEEADLLDFLLTTGAADKGTKTLEELNERRPETMLMLTDQWADVSQVILDTKAEAAQHTPEEDR